MCGVNEENYMNLSQDFGLPTEIWTKRTLNTCLEYYLYNIVPDFWTSTLHNLQNAVLLSRSYWYGA
jgi:hypothetical protein